MPISIVICIRYQIKSSRLAVNVLCKSLHGFLSLSFFPRSVRRREKDLQVGTGLHAKRQIEFSLFFSLFLSPSLSHETTERENLTSFFGRAWFERKGTRNAILQKSCYLYFFRNEYNFISAYGRHQSFFPASYCLIFLIIRDFFSEKFYPSCVFKILSFHREKSENETDTKEEKICL